MPVRFDYTILMIFKNWTQRYSTINFFETIRFQMSNLPSNTSVASSTKCLICSPKVVNSSQNHNEKTNQDCITFQRKEPKKGFQKKWEKEEMQRLLCFVVRYTIDHPYYDIEDILLDTSCQQYHVLEMISKNIGSRTIKQCRRFISTIISEVHRRTNQHLVAWAVQKLEKHQGDSEVQKLVLEFKKFKDTKSRYMTIIGELDDLLKNGEIF